MGKKPSYEELEQKVKMLEEKLIVNKYAEKELKKSEERYRMLFTNNHSILLLIDPKTADIVDANPAAVSFYGWSHKEITSKKITNFNTLPENKVLKKMKEASKAKEICFNFQHRLANGEIRDVEEYDVPISISGRTYLYSNIYDISSRRKAECELGEIKERYTKLFHYSSDGIVIHDLDGNILDINPKLLDLVGYSKSEMLPLKISMLHPPEDLEKSKLAFEKIVKKGFVSFEINFKRKNGDVFPAEVSSSMFKIGEKKIIQGIVRNIARSKQVEKELIESRAMFEAIVESLPFDIFGLDKNQLYFYQNSICRKNWGNLIGKSPKNVSVSKETKRLWMDNNRRAFSGETVTDEVVYCPLNKEKRYYYNIISPIRDNKKVFGILGVLINITRLKKTEEALRDSRERFRNLTEATSDWIWEVDKNGYYTYISPKIRDILGYREEEILGKTPFDLMVPEEADRVRKIFDTIRASQRPFYCLENINRHKNGHSVVLETSGIPVFSGDGEFCGFRGIDRNITRRKRTETELREAHAELEIRVEERTKDLENALKIIKEREGEIEQRKMSLERVNKQLLETNQGLSALARNIDKDKEVMEKRISQMINIKIIPIIKQLQKDKIFQKRGADLEVLATYVNDILPESTFYNEIETSLSEQELRVMVLVKNGLISQKIADMLNISIDTVKTHRKNIRRKLKIQNAKINLTSYLKSKFKE